MIPIRNSIGYILAKERGWKSLIKGGSGSGNFGHEGRPGEVGGSGEGINTNKTAFERVSSILGNQLHITEETSEIVKKHIEDLSMFPENILKILKDKGVSFYIGDKSIVDLDDNKDLKGKLPRGWPAGSSWDSVGGCYRHSLKSVNAGSWRRSGSVSAIGHETGHAIFTNIIEAENDFAKIKKLEDLHEKYYPSFTKYYQQDGIGGNVGVREMFAESVAHALKEKKLLLKSKPFYVINSNKEFASEVTNLIKKWGIV